LIAASKIVRVLGMLAAAAAMAPRSVALLDFNDGHDQVTVSATYGITYDSNLFAQAGGSGDYSQALALGAQYTRRAGLIGVNASLAITSTRFREFSGEDFNNPACNLEFTKGSGRLTGSVGLSAQRESRSDAAVNVFASSWNYGSSLRFRYPINSRYYFTSASEFSLRDYVDNNALFNLASYSEAIDVFYVYTSKLDLLGGYRIRWGDAQGGSRTQDHALTLGATGGILPKLNGSFRLGYQWRNESGDTEGRFHSLTTGLSLAWPLTTRVTFTGAASKDFTTTATDVSVNVTAFSVSASLKPTFKLKVVLNAGVDYSISEFLGSRGGGRQDHAWSFNAGLTFPLSARFSASISYASSDNHSNIAFSDFARHTATFNLSARF
jgi:hypothetical protein